MSDTDKKLLEWLASLSPRQFKEIKELIFELEDLRVTDPKLYVTVINDIKQWSLTNRTVGHH